MRTRDRNIVILLALALTLLAVMLTGCAGQSAPSPTRIVIYDHGQATAVEPQSSRFRSIGEQAARLVSQARDEIAALGFPWEAAARCTQEQVAVEVVFAEPGVQAGVHGAYTSALIPLDQEHEPGLVSVYLGRERYTLLVPTRGDEALAALCELAGVPAPPVRRGPLPPTVAPAAPTGPAALSDAIAICATVIRRLCTRDDSFGGSYQPAVVYLLRRTNDAAGDPRGPARHRSGAPRSDAGGRGSGPGGSAGPSGLSRLSRGCAQGCQHGRGRGPRSG
ncbi:MAG TPA: hypothetical protein PLJ35_22440 [Anaerolineae bacterium]|nr:hypothetical protein [Anaerolineae bacterium]HOR01583.1 hypothetical protein [Anaerolineae bacterium]HPL29655.1 hypothetical protein [Anaerolineae bacterium]